MLSKKLFIGVIALGLAPMAFANGAYAPATFTPGIYVGVQGGWGTTGWDALKSSSVSVKNYNGLAGRIFAGYDFHKNFAVEGGFTYWFNRAKVSVAGLRATSTDYRVRNWALDLVGKIKAEVYQNVELYAKAGVDYVHTKWDTAYPGLNKSYGNVNLVYGVGATYYFTPQISADLSWTRFNGRQKTAHSKYQPYLDMVALGVAYKFNLS
ncbi:MAG: outer membrane beta-barrel protein [Gammaproteobacteria bacterium]|nr:outer membrane beta-barrel protein [Gammaproteobacteria bacterium]